MLMARNRGQLRQRALWTSAVVLASLLTPMQGRSDEPIQVSFALQETVTLHEPVYANFSVLDKLAESLRFDLGFDRKQNFRFSITQPDGSTAELRPYLRGGLGLRGDVTLGPGETYQQSILMNELYDLSRVGDYVIAVGLVTAIGTVTGREVGPVPLTKLTLRVGERDSQRLAEVCDRLAKRATGADYQAALDATLALGYVRDPITVPFLGRVLDDGDIGVKSVAAKGLARIGSPEAVQVLKSHLTTKDDLLKYYIQAALLQVREGREREPKD